MSLNPKQQEFYEKLEKQLEEGHNFPDHYTFKFIFENQAEPLAEMYNIFDGLECSIATKESAKGKYVSANIHCFVLDAQQVIAIYKKAGVIKNIILL
jgi:uncharacterized protein